MKRLVLAGAALCCACFAQARVDLEYHAAPPKDNKVPEEYQKTQRAAPQGVECRQPDAGQRAGDRA